MAEIKLDVAEDQVALGMEIAEAQTVLETDHEKLTNRDAENSHPMSAITGLDDAVKGINKSIEENKVQILTKEETEEILNAD